MHNCKFKYNAFHILNTMVYQVYKRRPQRNLSEILIYDPCLFDFGLHSFILPSICKQGLVIWTERNLYFEQTLQCMSIGDVLDLLSVTL